MDYSLLVGIDEEKKELVSKYFLTVPDQWSS
jgi:hypothetical protein